MFGLDWNEYEITWVGRVRVRHFDNAFSVSHKKVSRVVVIAMRSRCVEIYNLASTNKQNIILTAPEIRLPEDGVTLTNLSKYFYHVDVITILEEYTEQRFFDIYPSSCFYDEIVGLWNYLELAGWQLYQYAGWRLGVRKDVVHLDGTALRSILVAENGVWLFSNRIIEVNDRGIFIVAENLSVELLAGFMIFDDAEEAYRMHLMLRRWIFRFAMRREQEEE